MRSTRLVGTLRVSGAVEEFASPSELAKYLVESDDAQRAFVNRAFQHFVKQPPAAYGIDTEEKLLASFRKNEFSIRKLLVEIAVVAAMESEVEAAEQDDGESDNSTKISG